MTMFEEIFQTDTKSEKDEELINQTYSRHSYETQP